MGLLIVRSLLGLLSKEPSDWFARCFRGPKLKVDFNDDGEDCNTFTPEVFDIPAVRGAIENVRSHRQVYSHARIQVTKCQNPYC